MKKELLPRPLRACLWALLAILTAVSFYISLGCPTLSMRQEFRRAEKAHMVGPSTIIDLVEDYHDYDDLIVAESDHGIIFFGRNKYDGTIPRDRSWHYYFSYVEKQPDMTLAVAPNLFGFAWDLPHVYLPIYLFTENQQAVRAEIEMTIIGSKSWLNNDQRVSITFNETFSAQSQQLEAGVFRFTLDCEDEYGGAALCALSSLAQDNYHGLTAEQKEIVIPVTVRLYDDKDQLILEQVITIDK